MKKLIPLVAIVALTLAACSGVPAGDSATSSPNPAPPVVPTAAQPTSKPTPVPPVTPQTVPADAPATPSPQPTPRLVPLPKFSVKVPNATKVRYFDISGETPSALVDETVQHSKSFCGKGVDALACVKFAPSPIRWTTRTNLVTGSCLITSASVRVKSTVALPRWKAPHLVQPALVTWWKPVIKHFAWHEAQHIKIARSYNSKLKSQLVGHKCSAAKGIIRKWERSLDKAQAKFDKKDLSWQPYVVPYTGPGGYFGESIT